MPACTVVFDLSGCRLSRIRWDFVGRALHVVVVGFSLCHIVRALGMVVVHLTAEEISKVFVVLISLQPAVSGEDHLTLSCWWGSYALTVVD